MLTDELKKKLVIFQNNEITEAVIYEKLAAVVRDENNKSVLKKIAADEKKHYHNLKKLSRVEVGVNKWKVWKFYLLSRVLGLTFGIKLMENAEERAQEAYASVYDVIPELKLIKEEEEAHEKALIDMLNEDRLKYVGSVVLGLNDALVELTGALAGFTLALQEPKLVATAGFITGIAASFSMAASEYLSTKSEQTDKSPIRASLYTGLAYIFTVLFLIFPYLVLANPIASLGWTLCHATIIILFFTFYTAIAMDLPFRKRFAEMIGISFSVAGFSFIVGFFVKKFIGLE
ncbi:MAG: VIT1/CCC1 transporter family protein [Deltaproteobacteria bacterium]|nr:VIT1/CCC1 transporter family protein [Deltaproteobacteria bacterium]